MIKSIEMMLGMAPMNRFDLLARPIDTCFNDKPSLTAYRLTPNKTPLGWPNPGRKTALSESDEYWLAKTREQDFSKMDRADPYWMNRIIWYSLYKDSRPYPSRPGEQPGQAVDLDD